jgi:hypothetical protein
MSPCEMNVKHAELIGVHREMSSTDLYARMCEEKGAFTPMHPYERTAHGQRIRVRNVGKATT